MSFYLKMLGAVLLVVGALLLGRGYTAYTKRRLAEHEGFLSLLLHIKSKISCFLTPAGELLSDFRCESLEAGGFLSAVREGRPLAEVYSEAEGAFAVSEETKAHLSSFFSEFGKGYKDGELARVDYYIDILKRTGEALGAETEKSVKIVKTLLCAAALGLVILLI